MDKQKQVEHLRTKYIELSRQYLTQLQSGKTISELKDLADLIGSLVAEIDVMEAAIKKEQEDDIQQGMNA